MSTIKSFLIFDEFENNKENIDPLTGLCSNINPNFSNKLSNNKKRVPLRDITPVIKKTPKSNDVNSMVTFVPPVFNLIVKPSVRNNSIDSNVSIRSLR